MLFSWLRALLAFVIGLMYSAFATLMRPFFTRETRPAPQCEWIRIPDNLSGWRWPRAVNRHMEECSAASDAWLQQFNLFSPEAQAAFNRCRFGLLASLGYPTLDRDGCRVACDLMSLFFVFDELSDVSDGFKTRQQADCIMDALYHPERLRPPGEWVGGLIAQQFWLNAIKTATPHCQERFISSFKRYTDAVVQQSCDRGDRRRVRDIESYFDLRRDTIGTLPLFALLELHMNIPDNVMSHPTVQRLMDLCTHMVSMGNDLYSYNVKQSHDNADHNLVTVFRQELGLSVQVAFDLIGKYHDDLAAEFMALLEDMPVFSQESVEVNREIREYVDGLGNWVRANECWSFESGRYFGDEGMKVRETLRFALLPEMNKVDHTETSDGAGDT